MRQGKASEGNEAVVTYGDLSESSDNEAHGNLYNHLFIQEASKTRRTAESKVQA